MERASSRTLIKFQLRCRGYSAIVSKYETGKVIVEIDGTKSSASIEPMTYRGFYSIIVETRRHNVVVEEVADAPSIRVRLDGKRERVILDEAKRLPYVSAYTNRNTLGSGAQIGRTVYAPLSGRVVEVKVRLGQLVKSGDFLVVLEAMKMQNYISAPVDGAVSELLVSPGKLVKKGDRILELS